MNIRITMRSPTTERVHMMRNKFSAWIASLSDLLTYFSYHLFNFPHDWLHLSFSLLKRLFQEDKNSTFSQKNSARFAASTNVDGKRLRLRWENTEIFLVLNYRHTLICVFFLQLIEPTRYTKINLNFFLKHLTFAFI